MRHGIPKASFLWHKIKVTTLTGSLKTYRFFKGRYSQCLQNILQSSHFMKVVSFSNNKLRSTGRDLCTRHTNADVREKNEIKLPDLDPSLTQIIDFKNPVLHGRDVQTNIGHRPTSSAITRNISLEVRPKTVQAQTKKMLP